MSRPDYPRTEALLEAVTESFRQGNAFLREELPLAPGIACQNCGNDTAYGEEPDRVFCFSCSQRIDLQPPLRFPDVSNT
jgi:hypothetical protein